MKPPNPTPERHSEPINCPVCWGYKLIQNSAGTSRCTYCRGIGTIGSIDVEEVKSNNHGKNTKGKQRK